MIVMANDTDIKPPKQFYYQDYDNLIGFISYFYQIDLVRQLGLRRILEIGVGNKTVSNYLKHNGFDITTCDYDKNLEPDYVADIRELPFEDNSYDVVMACEIIEHLPWDDVAVVLKELHRVTSKYVVISVPYTSVYFEIAIRFPFFNKIFKRPCLDLFLRLPLAIFKTYSEHHQWEIGTKGCSLRRLRKALKKYFRIVQEVRPLLNPRHYFFVLEKL